MTQICFLPLSEIKLYYRLLVSTYTFKKRANYMIEKGLDYPYLTVEYDQGSQEYILIEGYQEYETLNFINPELMVPCNYVQFTGEVEQLYKILKRLFAFERSSWRIKYDLMRKLLNSGESEEDITRNLSITKTELNRYKIKSEVPRYYIPRGLKNNAATKLNRISKLQLDSKTKDFLYKKAVLPEGDPDRLIHDQLDVIIRMLNSVKGFHRLNLDSQIYVFEQVLNYRSILNNYWQQMIDEKKLKGG
jgi:hypothetical protein